MRLLYIASNPSDLTSLNLEREITELQRQASEVSAEPISFVFLPGLRFEELPRELNRHRPDVVHLAAHADDEKLALAHEGGGTVEVTARMLGAFFSRSRPPRLVYVNACDSDGIADDLVKQQGIAAAIGSTAPITNRAARNAALAFYGRILDGESVSDAFETGVQMLEALEGQRASAKLFHRPDIDPKMEVLHRRPRLVASLAKQSYTKPGPGPDTFLIRLGLTGCSPNTTQTVFFTDDETFIDPKRPDDTGDLCFVVRATPVRGTVWASNRNLWEVRGDFRIFASGVTGDGEHFTVSSTLCEALETRQRLSRQSANVGDLLEALRVLRARDGSLDEPLDQN
jgi:hypothetical protein